MSLIFPAMTQILWTVIVILLAGRSRLSALQAREVRMDDVALSNSAWPDRAKAFGNNMNNQFETPVLFYALTGIAIYTGATGWVMLALAWGYVASRIVHTLIHVNGNNVPRRFQAFVIGLLLLTAMWAGIMLRLLR